MEAAVQVDGDDDRRSGHFGGFDGIIHIVSRGYKWPAMLAADEFLNRSAATGSIRGSFPGYHIDAYVMGMFELYETTHSR